MLEYNGRKIYDDLREVVSPKHTGILVWDMQYDIATKAFNFQEILANIGKLLPVARSAGVQVIHSQQTAFDLKNERPVWVRQRRWHAKVDDPAKIPLRTVEGTRGWEIVDELKPLSGDIVFQKHRPSAYVGTDLDLILRNLGLETLVLTGVSTEGGIEGSARQGLNLGYYMVPVSDCIGSSDKEGHDHAVAYLQKNFNMPLSKQLIEIWGHS